MSLNIPYDFRTAEKLFLENIKMATDLRSLASTLVNETNTLIPVERIGFFSLRQPEHRLTLVSHSGFDALAERSLHFELENLKSKLRTPVALSNTVETGILVEPADASMFARWGLAVVFPIIAQDGSPLAFLALGPKTSDVKFTGEDIDLLANAAAQSGLAIERLNFQHKLFLEQAENQRLNELNQLKSEFVSYVSHEFRTPLTSIQLYAELLENPEHCLREKGRQYTAIITGEALRLGRMVNNILDAARMESHSLVSTKSFHNLSILVRQCLEHMQYRLTQQQFKVVVSIPFEPVIILADGVALQHAIENLLDNAIKYSTDIKKIHLTVSRDDSHGICAIRDFGRGISKAALPHLFEKFYRDPSYSHRIQGTGVGLTLVKHIMDAHNGKVSVTSTPGSGSTFSLSIPLVESTTTWLETVGGCWLAFINLSFAFKAFL